jgi:hypothetical protein
VSALDEHREPFQIFLILTMSVHEGTIEREINQPTLHSPVLFLQEEG